MSKTANEKFNMMYSIATNFDTKLIDEIAKMDTGKSIKSVYGKMKSDIIGGGRASMVLPPLSMDNLKNYIKLCHKNGLEFNYLLNPMCLSNKELQKDSRNEIIKFIEDLEGIGIDWITVNSPYLCKVVKKDFPGIKVSIGVHSCVCELQHIKYWEDMGADEITLQMYINRNFELLERMLNYTKGSGVALRVFGNSACLHNCSYRMSHATGQSHASRTGERSAKFYMDNNLMNCTTEKVENPTHMIAAEWIRPEDVKYYEALCDKTGNHKFSIKLVERTKPTEYLLNVAKAYLSRGYEGNLLDIILWPAIKEMSNVSKPLIALESASEPDKLAGMKRFMDFFKLPDIYIDNKKLDGFVEKFVSNYECNKKVCNGMQCPDGSNRVIGDSSLTCSYCKSWAEKVISYDKQEVDAWLDKSREILNDVIDGKILC
ncbi:collagenase-like PrtC family protease [Anaerobacterium chartisolvens]|uniref:Collagenase-like PrtC family protease n=1 Tax=Anaerobacterium chartisolvens TaxID=1297424 RepID=A0A369B7K5_9FIRM|nr:U32 family peptidase [Anaerobacterium chartisolvens]RCX16517.1 collagenase-like PrtC family protease [Anaerobacterium chartisolvens]